MNDAAVKRPPILTGACVYLGLLSAVISIRAVTVATSWNAESRADDVGVALRLLRDAGLGADGAETFYRAFLTVLAVLAASGVVFAIHTAKGDRVSRVGMTVTIGVAGLATFAGALGTTFFMAMLGALAVVFTVRLWTGEIRTYFRTLAGHPPPPAPTPPPHVPWGPEPMPRPVAFAVWSTLIGSIVAAGLSALLLLFIVVGGISYDAIVDQGGPGADMIGSQSDYDRAISRITTLTSISIVLGLAGVAAATRALVKRRAGGVPLFVLAVVTAIFSAVGFPIGLPWTVLAVVVLVKLRSPEAKAWFSHR